MNEALALMSVGCCLIYYLFHTFAFFRPFHIGALLLDADSLLLLYVFPVVVCSKLNCNARLLRTKCRNAKHISYFM